MFEVLGAVSKVKDVVRADSTMRTPSKEKGKASQRRAVEDIIFSTDMAALDFQPSREEETFLQIIGLDRFLTRVTWEILNTAVVREVIANFNLDTMESVLNGQTFPIFGKDWRNKMRTVFYLTAFSATREPGTPKVRAANIFPNYADKIKTRAGTCKITECTIQEARRPLRFFNSLFLLRTNTNTISCQAIAHIADALNGKLVDWPELFKEIMLTELRTLKEELFKDKTTMLKSMVGPPLTMLLIDEGLLSVQQELEAGILMPHDIVEKPNSKKRKLGPSMELTLGEPSKSKEVPHICVAMATPTMATPAIPEPKANSSIVIDIGNPLVIQPDSFKKKTDIPKTLSATMELATNKNVLISTVANGSSKVNLTPLKDIFHKLQKSTKLLEKWITAASEKAPELNNTDNPKFTEILQGGTSSSNLQTKSLLEDYSSPTFQPAPAILQPTDAELQLRAQILHNQHANRSGRNEEPHQQLHIQPTTTLKPHCQQDKDRDYLQQEAPKPAPENTEPAISGTSLHDPTADNLIAHTQEGFKGDLASSQTEKDQTKPDQTSNAAATGEKFTHTHQPSLHDAEERNPHQSAETMNQDLQRQLEELRNQQAAELQRIQTQQEDLRKQLQISESLHKTELEHRICTEKDALQQQHDLAITKIKQILTKTQTEKTSLQKEVELLRTQHMANQKIAEETQVISKQMTTKIEFEQAQHAAEIERSMQLKKNLHQLRDSILEKNRHRKELTSNIAHQLSTFTTKIRSTLSDLRNQMSEQSRAFQIEIQTSNTQLKSLATYDQHNPHRITELTKLEAFDLWMKRNPQTDTKLSAETLLNRVTSKIQHTLKNLKTELSRATQERDDLQTRMEQQEEADLMQWQNLFGEGKIEDPANLITATRKNLPPPISIYQYYLAYKPMILKQSNLPDLKARSQLSREQFQILWAQADSAARDVLTFMWVLKDLVLPKGVVELTSANPNFYLTRFCISALFHIQRHHEDFYTNLENRNSLPQIEPYNLDLVKEIQDMTDSSFPEFLSAIDTLAGEDTSLLHQANHMHQTLVRKYPDSFPQNFHRIQLNGYITRALEDRKRTIEQRIVSTPNARTLLYLPQYDPGNMKISKRS